MHIVAQLGQRIGRGRIGATDILGDRCQAAQGVIVVVGDDIPAVGFQVQGAVRRIILIQGLIGLCADVQPVVGVEGPAQGFQQDATRVMNVFIDHIAFGIEGVFDIVAMAVIDACQAACIVIREGDCGGVRRGIAPGDGFDFTRGQVGPACRSGFAGRKIGERLCFQAVITGVIGEVHL